jgi:hypothetical protein
MYVTLTCFDIHAGAQETSIYGSKTRFGIPKVSLQPCARVARFRDPETIGFVGCVAHVASSSQNAGLVAAGI